MRYNRWRYNCLNHASGDTFKLALLANTYTPDPDDNQWADVSSHEVSGAGYPAGGWTLSNVSVSQDDTNNEAVFDFDDIDTSNSTITARYAILYNATTGDLWQCIDFGEDKSSSGTDFDYIVNANGQIRLRAAT